MTKLHAQLVTLLASCLVALSCGRSPIGSDDGLEAGPDLAPDLPVDPAHCGQSETNCVGPMGIGDCVEGECQGRLFNCWTAGSTCADACAEQPGSSCAEGRCEGATAFGWGGQDHDESVELCTWADEASATPLTLACDEPLPFADFPGIRCCCKW
ncbi:hypothetical protein ENSA5_28400 [Enhygromyxa salina]|uniref:Uncharacterized protein n=1 Tax=Enhygromyxa salina TaxID=215803 RepID=A0A2S9Y4M6_9BACT|nr:hypothetical protein [Enhygromyxa salina]PRQ00026.1 hypothetical protein ENSA5_28400 [Enhygromyxa salina]